MLVDDKLLVGDLEGNFHALKAATGAKLWATPLGSTRFQGGAVPAVADGRAFFAISDKVVALDAKTGELLHAIDATTWTSPVLDNGLLYLAVDKELRAYSPETGHLYWRQTAGGRISRPMAAAAGKIVYVADDLAVYAVAPHTGAVAWKKVVDTYGSGHGSPIIAGGLVYVGRYMGGLRVLNLSTGEQAGLLLPTAKVHQWVVATDTRLYVPSASWGVWALTNQP